MLLDAINWSKVRSQLPRKQSLSRQQVGSIEWPALQALIAIIAASSTGTASLHLLEGQIRGSDAKPVQPELCHMQSEKHDVCLYALLPYEQRP